LYMFTVNDRYYVALLIHNDVQLVTTPVLIWYSLQLLNELTW
jgi:hypothetical protein